MYLGYYTKDKPDNNKLDIVVIEATAITEDGWIVPGASVGATPELIQMADKIIIEVNTRIPSFEGLHDINMCTLPPNRKPYLIMNTEDRIGTVSVTEKVNGRNVSIINIYIFFRLLSLLIPTRLLPLLRVIVLIKLVVIHLLIPSLKLLQTISLSSLKKKSNMVVFLLTCCLSNQVLVILLMPLLVVWPSPVSKMLQCKFTGNVG